jgi:hypothetical protein
MISRSVDAQREIEMPLQQQDDDLGTLSPQESAMLDRTRDRARRPDRRVADAGLPSATQLPPEKSDHLDKPIASSGKTPA